jgi:hypothetical protein
LPLLIHEHVLKFLGQFTLLNQFLHISSAGISRIKLDEGFWPEFIAVNDLGNIIPDTLILNIKKAGDVGFIAGYDGRVDIEDIHW